MKSPYPRVRAQLRMLARASPGERFQELNQRCAARRQATVRRFTAWIGGVSLVLLGLVSYPIPGPPSTLIIVAGLSLLASVCAPVARGLDRAELRASELYRRLSVAWRSMPRRRKAAVALSSLSLAVLLVLGAQAL